MFLKEKEEPNTKLELPITLKNLLQFMAPMYKCKIRDWWLPSIITNQRIIKNPFNIGTFTTDLHPGWRVQVWEQFYTEQECCVLRRRNVGNFLRQNLNNTYLMCGIVGIS
jgi:hypothetical protein